MGVPGTRVGSSGDTILNSSSFIQSYVWCPLNSPEFLDGKAVYSSPKGERGEIRSNGFFYADGRDVFFPEEPTFWTHVEGTSIAAGPLIAGRAVAGHVGTKAVAVGRQALKELGEEVAWAYIDRQLPFASTIMDFMPRKRRGGGAVSPGSGRYRGGAHRDMSGPHTRGDTLESHHMPDRGADPGVSAADGPAIQMGPLDHQATSSWGSSRDAARYRAETAEMIRV